MTSRIENDAELPDGSVLLGKVLIQMYLPTDSSEPIVRTQMIDSQGGTLPLIQTLGMIDIARQTAWDISQGNLEENHE